jgi:hypothetical protein
MEKSADSVRDILLPPNGTKRIPKVPVPAVGLLGKMGDEEITLLLRQG